MRFRKDVFTAISGYRTSYPPVDLLRSIVLAEKEGGLYARWVCLGVSRPHRQGRSAAHPQAVKQPGPNTSVGLLFDGIHAGNQTN